jgi:hypothetical protein
VLRRLVTAPDAETALLFAFERTWERGAHRYLSENLRQLHRGWSAHAPRAELLGGRGDRLGHARLRLALSAARSALVTLRALFRIDIVAY